MSFKKSGRFLSENRAPGILGPWLPLNTLIDLANNAPASNSFLDAICLFSEGYRTKRGVTGPMNFKKIRTFFFSETRAPGILGPLTATQALLLTFQTLLWLLNVY